MDALRPLSTLRPPAPVPPGAVIGLYGGSFNPPHRGHRHVAETARIRFGLDRVWVLVSPQNPLKSSAQTAPYPERLAAARAMMSGPRVAVTDFEARVGSRYTVETLRALRRRFPRARFVMVMGADGFAGLHRWRNWRALAALAPIAVVSRQGWTLRAQLCPAAKILPRRSPRELRGTHAPGWSYVAARFNPASSTAIRARSSR